MERDAGDSDSLLHWWICSCNNPPNKIFNGRKKSPLALSIHVHRALYSIQCTLLKRVLHWVVYIYIYDKEISPCSSFFDELFIDLLYSYAESPVAHSTYLVTYNTNNEYITVCHTD